MDWYAELASLEYLNLVTGTKILGWKLPNLRTAELLFSPTCVNDYDNFVICKDKMTILYRVNTIRIPGGFELRGKITKTIKPYFWTGSQEELVENFMVIPHTKGYITTMLRERARKANKKLNLKR